MVKSLREVRWPERGWSEVRFSQMYLDVSVLPARKGCNKVLKDGDDTDLCHDGYTPSTGWS